MCPPSPQPPICDHLDILGWNYIYWSVQKPFLINRKTSLWSASMEFNGGFQSHRATPSYQPILLFHNPSQRGITHFWCTPEASRHPTHLRLAMLTGDAEKAKGTEKRRNGSSLRGNFAWHFWNWYPWQKPWYHWDYRMIPKNKESIMCLVIMMEYPIDCVFVIIILL